MKIGVELMPYMDNRNAERLINTYADMILRIAFMYLGQTCDAEDICQDIFLKLLEKDLRFDDAEHEKARIIRATVNAAKDSLRTSFWKRSVALESANELSTPEGPERELLEAVLKLPKNYRISIYLHYYEGYRVREIAEMLGKPENTVSAYLSRGRKKLKTLLEGGGDERKSTTKGAMHYVR